VTPEAVALEATDLQRRADGAGIAVRLIGSLAVALRCPGHRYLLAQLGRRPPRDIDFVGYARDERALDRLLAERGYVLHPSVSHSREWGVKRLIYTHPEHAGKVDVFLDQLVMAHTIDFSGLLEREPVTVSLADLLLSKVQIYRITDNDLIDLAVLLAEHDLGRAPEEIGLDRVTKVLGSDWGFTYGARLNLAKLADALETMIALEPRVADRVRARVRGLEAAIEAAPKTTMWRLRARVGTRTSWYEHVDDVEI
jgi:hypothetical protein